MGISVRDRKLLWTKAGNRCSYNYKGVICDKELIISDDGKDVIVGKECHIVDRRPSTSRYIKDFPGKDSYNNLILLCGKHHDLIDTDGEKYTVKVLRTMKEAHEKSIAERIKNREIEPMIIKDSVFKTEAKDVDEAIGMEVNKPAQISNVTSELKANNVRRAVGFSTNQCLTSILTSCSYCNEPFPVVCTGTPPKSVKCPHCGKENTIDIK